MQHLIKLTGVLLITTILFFQGGCKKEKETKNFPDVTATADTVFGILKYKQVNTSGNKLLDWPFGPATFKAIVGVTEVIATATINTDGTFMLILPATLSSRNMSNLSTVALDQGGTLKVNPDNVKFLEYIQFKVDYTDNGVPYTLITSLQSLNADLTTKKSYYFNFYDMDGSFIGKSTIGTTYNWAFKKGWGIVESFITDAEIGTFDSKSLDKIPDDAIWIN